MTGSGTIGDPYIISTVADLQAMENALTAYYELGGNIDASATSGWNGGAGFIPISTFEGHFNGEGYLISSLFINRLTADAALFDYLSGDVTQVGVGCDFTTGSATHKAAGLAVYNGGTISKSFTTGSIIAGTDLTFPTKAGGLVQYNGGTIANCYSRCSVQADLASGLIQENSVFGEESNSYSTGAVISYKEVQDDVYPNGDYSAVGTWGIYPSDGVYYNKLLSNDSDTTYIQAQANDCVALFTIPFNVPIGVVMRYLRLAPRVRNVGSGTSSLYRVTRIGGVNYNDVGGNITLQSYVLVRSPASEPNPVTGNPYTVDEVNTNIQAMGIKITDASPNLRCTEFCVQVYTLQTTLLAGLCHTNDGTVSNSFWDTETSGHSGSSGGTGKTTAQMKTQATFTDAGWDFSTLWYITASINSGYPAFTTQRTTTGFVPRVYII